MTRTRALVVFALASLTSCRAEPTNLLAGRVAVKGSGIPAATLITDGRAAAEGGEWNASTAAVFDRQIGYVDFDLGSPTRIRSGSLQADNNDEYMVWISDDGAVFRELWIAPAVTASGLRTRTTSNLDATARFVRLAARGGDGHYSVTELQLYADPSPGAAVEGNPGERVRTRLLYVLIAFGLALFATSRESSRTRVFVAWLLVGAAIVASASAIAADWPLGGADVSFVRAIAAAIVLLALLRAAKPDASEPPSRPMLLAAGVFGAVVAFACFYNLGRPQFVHAGRGRPLFVHTLDMRVYQPFVKYFPELRYDGVYLASVLAYAEDERQGSLATLGAVDIRDQVDHRMRRVADLEPEIRGIRARFSDARWASFKRDMTFFRNAMGPAYMTTLTDHGANAPPPWVLVAGAFIGHVTASEISLTIAGLVDAALLLGAAGALARCFGLWPMLAAMTVFGATELANFGSNWGGATLRHDWLALLAFAACALRRRHHATAGVLLGVATMLRLLPAVAIVGVALPAVVRLVERWRRGERPSLATLRTEHRDAVRVIAAATASMLVLFVVTGVLYSFGAWGEWWRKIVLLNAGPADNEVSLRALVAGTQSTALDLLRARMPLYIGAQLACLVAVALSARRRPLDEAMLLALPLMFVFSSTVNYHAQVVFLLPLVAARNNLLRAAAPLLAMCIAQYWAAIDPDATRRFQLMTVTLFAALGWLYVAARGKHPTAAAA